MKNPSQPPSKNKPSKSLARYTGIGFQMIGIIVVGVLIGTQLDQRLATNNDHWYTIGFTLAFVIISMIITIRQIISE